MSVQTQLVQSNRRSNTRLTLVLAAGAALATAGLGQAMASTPLLSPINDPFGLGLRANYGPGIGSSGAVAPADSSSTRFFDPGAAGGAPVGGGLEASLTWNSSTGNWSDITKWSPSQAPVAADNLTFPTGAANYTATNDIAGLGALGVVNVTNTGAGVPTLTGGFTASQFLVDGNSTATLGAGTYSLTNTATPGVGAPGAPNGTTSVSVGITSGVTSTLNINGGAIVNYNQMYAGQNTGSNGILNISGAGTLVRPNAATAAANGRWGSLAGNATINISDGAEVQARLYEFGRQNAASNTTINVTNGGKMNSDPVTVSATGGFSQVVLPRGEGASATLNVNTGGSVSVMNSFTGANALPGTTTVNVGASGNIRMDGVFVVNGGGGAGAAGTTNLNVTGGGVLSVGRLNGGQDSASAGQTATTNILVDGLGSKLEAKNSQNFANSYIVLNQADLTAADGNATSVVTVRNQGQIIAVDDDAAGGAFVDIGSGNKSTATLNIESGGFVGTNQTTAGRGGSVFIGGGNLSATTTVNIGSTTANTSVLQAVGSPDGTGAGGAQLQIGTGTYTGIDDVDNTVTVNVNSGGRLFAGPSVTSFVAIDYDTTVNLNVSGTGVMDLGNFVSLGGGNSTTTAGSLANSGGKTNLTVSGGGTFVVDGMALARDYGDIGFPTEKIVTNITVTGAGSTLTLDGTDDTTTTGIDDGYFTTSIGATGSILTSDLSEITIKAQNGGSIKAGEASFLGDTKNGFTLVEVSGAGSVFDSSRQLTVNSDGLENSLATFNISGGGVLKTSSSAAQASGSMFFGTDPSTATGTSTVINVTGAGSKLQSSSGIFLGAAIDTTTSAIVDGTPVTLTAGAGTTVSAVGTFLVGSTSSVTTAGTVSVGGVALAGNWTVNGGSVTSTSLQLVGSSVLNVTPTNALAPVLVKTGNVLVGSSAKIDLHKNALQITPGGTTPTTLANVKTLIANGATGGITSADLTANTALGYVLVSTPGTFLGSPTAAGDILVRYTILGDADLSGNVNFDDLLALAANYNGSLKEWYQGDFTNDGNVNFDDLLKLAANYNQSVTGSFAGDWALAQSAVPEPTSLLAIGLGGAALLGRRRRR
jgi:hypothetical protein